MKDSHFEKLVKEALGDTKLFMTLLNNDVRFKDILSVLTGLEKKKIIEEMEKHKNDKDFLHKIVSEAFPLKYNEQKMKIEEDPQEKIKNILADELKLRGNQEQKNKNYENAIKSFKEALKLTPKDLNLNLNLASVYLEMRDYEKCIKECVYVLQNSEDQIKNFL